MAESKIATCEACQQAPCAVVCKTKCPSMTTFPRAQRIRANTVTNINDDHQTHTAKAVTLSHRYGVALHRSTKFATQRIGPRWRCHTREAIHEISEVLSSSIHICQVSVLGGPCRTFFTMVLMLFMNVFLEPEVPPNATAEPHALHESPDTGGKNPKSQV